MDLVTQEPHDRGSLRVHVQEPAAAPGVGCAARPPGCDHGGAARTGTTPPTRDGRLQGPQERRHSNENPSPFLTSGFTFVGQFVDHDITFDTTLLSEQQSDPYATTNFRTPRYDLDAIYGRGPRSDPQFYNPNDRDKFLIVETTRHGNSTVRDPRRPDVVMTCLDVGYDVPRGRTDGTAMIADPRNDQTLIILQLHMAMQMFHNRLVDYMRACGVPGRRCSSRRGVWPGGTTSGS